MARINSADPSHGPCSVYRAGFRCDGSLSIGALFAADRLQSGRRRRGGSRADGNVALERHACRPRCSAAPGWRRPTAKPTSPIHSRSTPDYPLDQVRQVDGDSWRLELSGLDRGTPSVDTAELAALPQAAQITAAHLHRGLERDRKNGAACRSAIFLRASAPTRVRAMCPSAAPTTTAARIDMATALHKQTLLALTFRDAPLPRDLSAFPMKLRVPTKLGFKNPKHIVAIEVYECIPGRILGGLRLQLVQRQLMSHARLIRIGRLQRCRQMSRTWTIRNLPKSQ